LILRRQEVVFFIYDINGGTKKMESSVSPVGKLLRSRKFMILLLDTLVSLILLVVASALPDYKEFAGQLWVVLQPAFVAVVVGITIEDSALKAVGVVFDEYKSALALLFQSRKFLLLLLDVTVGAVTLIVDQFYPVRVDLVATVITYLQPLVVAIIVGIAVEDYNGIKAG